MVLTHDDHLQRQSRRLDISEAVEAALVRTTHRGPNITFHTRLEPMPILSDASTLERTITNLLDNATKLFPSDGEIWVGLALAEVLTIVDSSLGIAGDDLPYVFDRFYRFDRTRSTPDTGLDLAIVTRTVGTHGGSIRTGNQQGTGVKFTMRLPVLNIPGPSLSP